MKKVQKNRQSRMPIVPLWQNVRILNYTNFTHTFVKAH
jgi:hypothetical protein